MKGHFADPKHLSTVNLPSQHRESMKGVIGWTFFISPGVSRLVGSCFLAFLSPGTKTGILTNINWVVLPMWPCMCLWIQRVSEVVLTSRTCCLGSVCIEGVGTPERRGAKASPAC